METTKLWRLQHRKLIKTYRNGPAIVKDERGNIVKEVLNSSKFFLPGAVFATTADISLTLTRKLLENAHHSHESMYMGPLRRLQLWQLWQNSKQLQHQRRKGTWTWMLDICLSTLVWYYMLFTDLLQCIWMYFYVFLWMCQDTCFSSHHTYQILYVVWCCFWWCLQSESMGRCFQANSQVYSMFS